VFELPGGKLGEHYDIRKRGVMHGHGRKIVINFIVTQVRFCYFREFVLFVWLMMK